MQRRLLLALGLSASAGMVVNAASCDPRQHALDVFKRQGLNLLQPARDYVRPGGLVVVAKDRAEYEDPRDGVAGETGNLTNFRSIILQETQKKSAAFGAALALANSILPIGVQLSGSSMVSLAQIETTGVRLTTDALDELMRKPKTSAAARAELQQKHRVFVVQEVYQAKSLDLQSADQKALAVHYNDKTAVAECKTPAGTVDKPSSPEVPAEKSKTVKPSTAPSPNPASPATPASSAPGGAESKPSEKKSPDTTAVGTGLGVGVAVCRSGDFTLKLTASEPIAFAVRLAELEMSPDGSLRRKREGIGVSLGPDRIGAALAHPSGALTVERRAGLQ